MKQDPRQLMVMIGDHTHIQMDTIMKHAIQKRVGQVDY